MMKLSFFKNTPTLFIFDKINKWKKDLESLPNEEFLILTLLLVQTLISCICVTLSFIDPWIGGLFDLLLTLAFYKYFRNVGLIKIRNATSNIIATIIKKSKFEISASVKQLTHEISQTNSSVTTNGEIFGISLADQLNGTQRALASITSFATQLDLTFQKVSESNQLSEKINSYAENGKREILKGLEVQENMKSLEVVLTAVSNLILKMESEMNMIDQIMTESKLLSINASLEANRIGSEGNSFKVVAMSMGDLSSTCSKASEKIRELIKEGKSKVSGLSSNVKEQFRQNEITNKEMNIAVTNILAGLSEMKNISDQSKQLVTQQELGVYLCSEAMAKIFASINRNVKISNQAKTISGQLKKTELELAKLVDEELTGNSFSQAS